MSVLLVCPKNKGNTFNVCRYIADHSDTELFVIGQMMAGNLKDYTSIILCSGVYGDNLHKDLKKWLLKISETSINEKAKLYVFLTWFGRGKSDKNTIEKVKAILEKKELHLEDDYITCYGGGMGIVRSGHPNQEDYEKVLNWVNRLPS